MARVMRRRRLSTEELARNEARLAEVNGWLRTVDLTQWHVGHPVSIDGYLIGVMMTRLSDSYTILAQDGYMVALTEAGWQGDTWPTADEAAAWLALRERAQEGDAQ